MEIADYLRVARRSLWILLIVPLGAAMIAGAVAFAAPPKYEATATVDLPLGEGKSPYAGNHGQVLYVEDFRTAVTSAPVIAAVSASTGVDKKSLNAQLQVKQVADSSVMSIRFISPDQERSAAVVEATATAALDRILQTQYQAARPALEAALADRQPLLQRQERLVAQTDGLPPDVAIREVLREISSLKRQLHNMAARGKSPRALAPVERQLAGAQARLVAYRATGVEYERLQSALNAANQSVTKQSQVVQAITALQHAAEAPSTISVAAPVRISKLPAVLAASLAAAGAGAFLALGIITLMELTGRRHRAAGGEVAPDDQPTVSQAASPTDEVASTTRIRLPLKQK